MELDATIFGAFAHAAQVRPQAIAIRAGGDVVTYGRLAAMARGIAGRLRDGVAMPNAGFVGILLTDRVRMAAAMLGALAAGRPFVLLDPDDPPDRLAFILGDAEAEVMLTDGVHAAAASRLASTACRVVDIATLPHSEVLAAGPPASGDLLAYVCYTSGSTGRPKGVLQTQANLLHFVRAYAAMLGIGTDDRVSLVYSPGFSALFMDVFGALLHGATLCGYDLRHDGVAGLAAWIDRERVSILHTVPTVFRRLCASLPPGRVLEGVRAIDLGGEAVAAQDAALVARHFRAGCTCWNHLAATEASVIARYAVRPAVDARRSGLVPVGTPPPGVRVWIEDDSGGRAGSGASGRLVVSSPYVSPGYWRRPQLDARHFAADPDRPGWRVYRGDDRGRIDADGILHFEGRGSGRVKLRGHSIDLAEVEAAILGCPGVRDAAVIAVVDGLGEAVRLDAHVAATDTEVDPATLRERFVSRLPSYMVPATIRLHRELPQTPSGKVDRTALHHTGPVAPALTPPETAGERKVAGIFAAVLGHEAIGRETDFFDAGGDSLATVDLLARLSRATGRDIAYGDLLRSPTVAALAAAIDRGGEASANPHPLIVPLRTTGRLPPLFLVHGRLGQAHASRHLHDALGDEQPLYGIRARGLDGVQSPHETVQAMADDYVAAVRTIHPRGPYFLGGLCTGSYVTMLMAERLRREGEEVLPLLLFDPKTPSHRWRRWLPRRGRAGERQWIADKLARRRAAGRVAFPEADQDRLEAATNVVIAFERAFRRHVPRPYDGAVCLLVSSERLAAWRHRNDRMVRRIFRGEVHLFEGGPTHANMFDPRNPVVAKLIGRCVACIHGPGNAEAEGRQAA